MVKNYIKKDKKILIISTVIVIIAIIGLLKIDYTKVVLGENLKTLKERITETSNDEILSYVVYDNQDINNMKMLVTVLCNESIEYIEDFSGNKILGNGKNKIALDTSIKVNDEKTLKIKESNKQEVEKNICITEENVNDYLVTERQDDIECYNTIKMTYSNVNDGDVEYYKIGENTDVWTQYNNSDSIRLGMGDISEQNITNKTGIVNVYTKKVDKAGNIIYTTHKEEVPTIYEGIEAILDSQTATIKYYNNDTEILPIYWYGFENPARGSIIPWHESENVPNVTRNDKSFVYSAYMSYVFDCVGGITSSSKIDLANYNSFHMLIKNSDVNTQMQFIPITGYVGHWDEGAVENRNVILQMPAVLDEPVEYFGDISGATGSWYIGLQSWNSSTNMEFSAWWLEK